MSNRLIVIALASTAILAACATAQENPNYQYSTKFKGASPYATPTQNASNTVTTVTTQPVTYVQTVPAITGATQNASYQTVTQNTQTQNSAGYNTARYNGAQPASYTQLDHRCLSKETNRQLIGGALGGTVGAVLGKKVIGGTKGAVAGAALGGAAGYGIGDKSINCDPVQVPIAAQTPVVSQAYYPSNNAVYNPAQGEVVFANTQTVSPAAPTDAAMPAEITQGYGTPGYQAMLNAQNDTLDDINAYVPDTASAAVPAPQMVDVSSSTTAPYSISTTLGGQHQVMEGDTVYSLSRKLCTSIDDIKQMNGLGSDFNIKIGDSLRLPASRC
ncbi:LysM peptidoglycan-binding domain-containing protein [Fretibacter rubidus]|uniref:LysM peptidoglycan-binding domain-containing protein n=1 Tax=Fretibacter rubidus TaxID=570162 RepID=UPI00352AF68E